MHSTGMTRTTFSFLDSIHWDERTDKWSKRPPETKKNCFIGFHYRSVQVFVSAVEKLEELVQSACGGANDKLIASSSPSYHDNSGGFTDVDASRGSSLALQSVSLAFALGCMLLIPFSPVLPTTAPRRDRTILTILVLHCRWLTHESCVLGWG